MDAVDIMIRMDPSTWETAKGVPEGGPMDQQEITFVVDLKALETPEHVFVDGHGSWGKCGGDSIYYKAYGDQLQELRGSVGRDFTIKLTKARYRHPNSDNKLRKFVFTCRNPKGRLLRWAIVSYKWDDCLPFKFPPGPPVRNYGGPQYMFEKPKTPKRARVEKLERKEPIREVTEMFDRLPDDPEELAEFSQGTGWMEEAEEDSDIIDPEEEFQVGVVPFAPRAINTMIEAAHILLRREPPGPLCTVVPFHAPKKMRKITYLIDLQALDDPKDAQVDLHGSWGHNPGPEKAFFRYNAWGGVKRLDAGKGKIPDTDTFDVKMTKLRFLHERTERKLRKFIFIAQNSNGEYLRWGLISYQWFCEPFQFTPAPHGNAKRNLRPFQPTKPSVRTRLKELSLMYAPGQAVQEYLTEKGESTPMQLVAPHDLPRGPKQVSDSGRFPRSVHRAAAMICRDAEENIRPFLRNPHVFSVMDETLGKEEAKSYTVRHLGLGDFSCDCEEYLACMMCRHSLAVAKTQDEANEFVANLGDRITEREGEEASTSSTVGETEVKTEESREEEWEDELVDEEPPIEEEDGPDPEDEVKIAIKAAKNSWRRKNI